MTLVKLENKRLRKQPTEGKDSDRLSSETQIDQDEQDEQDAEEVKVVGDTSSKVYELVRRVLLLVRQAKRNAHTLCNSTDSANLNMLPTVKVLVFSGWTEVLDIIGKAFSDNGVDFRAAYPSHRFAVSNRVY